VGFDPRFAQDISTAEEHQQRQQGNSPLHDREYHTLVDIDFDIQLEERLTDRVFVSVVLGPQHQPVHIDGAAVEIVRLGSAVSPRLLLPIVGMVGQPIGTTVELRAIGPIPPGSRVVGSVWSGNSRVEVSCPCDPWTELEVHMRGTRLVALNEPGFQQVRQLSSHERQVVAQLFPWVDEPAVRRAPEPEKLVVDATDAVPIDLVGDIRDHYNLDEDDAAFLRELLDEE